MSDLHWVLVAGVLLVVASAVAAYSTDFWDDEIDGQRVVLHFVPGAGLFMAGVALSELVPDLFVVGAAVACVGIVVGLLGLPHPLWWGPGWYRRRRREAASVPGRRRGRGGGRR